jgi:hypothetical protein
LRAATRADDTPSITLFLSSSLLPQSTSSKLATTEVPMRFRIVLLSLSLYLSMAVLGCTKKADTDVPPTDSPAADTTSTDTGSTTTESKGSSAKGTREHERREPRESRREPVVVPAGTSVTVSLGSALGSKLSEAGQTFTGTVAKDIVVGNAVAIPQGTNVSGTVTDAKALGKFAGGAVLGVRLDSINVKGANLPVQAAVRTFTAKGKGKRTAVMTGGGAALGGIIGALAGGGKGAAIGMAAGGGAGVGGAALTGNKDIVLPAESAVSFELSQPLELR